MPTWYQTTQIARPDFYDRNAKTGAIAYNLASVAPHVLTTRFTYSVPATKKAWLDSIWMHITRSAVAGAVGIAEIRITETTFASGAQVAIFNYFNSNVLLADKDIIMSNGGFLSGGDSISVADIDTSTGGSCDFDMSCKRTEFDF